jgi:hypothetical protein
MLSDIQSKSNVTSSISPVDINSNYSNIDPNETLNNQTILKTVEKTLLSNFI